MKSKQSWIYSAAFDLSFILGPAIMVTTIVLIFKDSLQVLQATPPWLWLLLIVGVDVSHVYSTIFRTYLDKEELQKRQALYTLVPLAAWGAGCFLYSIDGFLFWRVLAYLAIFHFVRQQYGFMMVYSRHERGTPSYYKIIDKAAIYSATIYPLIYWHTHTRIISWFVDGDVPNLPIPILHNIALYLYIVILAAYLLKEIILWRSSGLVNIPRNLLLTGTASSWFIGIVAFDNDIIFTATNVIAHGIPYMALIWVYGNNHHNLTSREPSYIFPWIPKIFAPKMLPLYIIPLFLLAFIEEGIWDSLVWKEHFSIFKISALVPPVDSRHTLTWLVPLLVLPQVVHYVLDAFIWRLKDGDEQWKKILFLKDKRAV